ncbi:uncharacterized protein LAJ45_03907 [Morchella importuna]|uniref:uncharacterized protein n=1 Tax=Morchella importuna TaxID=1174673 RepID=UPI001E8D3B6E|nr:uncharacterized protein LAJ45_03907 [Morchella importuna]KAH8151914.1 hypothetical protein LAJ45_03907 [Morchella importuna]
MSMIAVVGFWLDQNATLRHGLLALRKMLGAHTGDNQGSLVWGVITEYKIEKILGYFTLDNASNNVTALDYIGVQINSSYEIQLNNPVFNTQSRFNRCYGHILNLVVKVFLYGKKSSRLANNRVEKDSIEQENREVEEWRKVGPLGKLRNITVWIQRSPQRRAAFAELVEKMMAGSGKQARQLILGNVTRWTGDYDALSRALEFRQAIDLHFQMLIMDDPKITISNDRITSDDWSVLQTISGILEPFREETLALEGNKAQGSLYEVYPSLQALTNHLAQTKSNLALQHSPLQRSLYLAIEKFNKYYSLETLSPILCAAIILNPNMDNFFASESGWGGRPDWVSHAKYLVRQLWITNYKSLSLHQQKISTPDSPRRNQNPAAMGPPKSVRSFKKPKVSPRIDMDEMDHYLRWCEHNEDELENPIQWWISKKPTYPKLSIFALDTFSVPAMAAECERVFSSAKHQITDCRNRLSEDIIESGECQKSWARSSLIAFKVADEMSKTLEKAEQDALVLETISN